MEGEATLGVYDVSGRCVRLLASGPFSAGEHRFAWDGRDEQGADAPAGVYFSRLEYAGKDLRRKMLLAR